MLYVVFHTKRFVSYHHSHLFFCSLATPISYSYIQLKLFNSSRSCKRTKNTVWGIPLLLGSHTQDKRYGWLPKRNICFPRYLPSPLTDMQQINEDNKTDDVTVTFCWYPRLVNQSQHEHRLGGNGIRSWRLNGVTTSIDRISPIRNRSPCWFWFRVLRHWFLLFSISSLLEHSRRNYLIPIPHLPGNARVLTSKHLEIWRR
jgi:hypothetical protein